MSNLKSRYQSIHCPFTAAGRIEDLEKFIGRGEFLNAMANRMKAVQVTSLNIVGEQRLGRSSLLYCYEQYNIEKACHKYHLHIT